MENQNGRKLKTIDRALEMVDFIQDQDGARISDITNRFGYSPGTVHGYVSTLESNGYLVKENGEYRIGLRFLEKGGYAATNTAGFRTVTPRIRRLAEQTGERADFIVEEHGRGIYVHSEPGDYAVHADSRIGKRIYLHAAAAGKAILSGLAQERVSSIIEQWGLPNLTDNTITEKQTLFDELERIADRGYAFNREEAIDGLRAVGAPIRGHESNIVGSVSVSGPSHRLKGEVFKEEIPDLILGIVNEIELNLEYPADS